MAQEKAKSKQTTPSGPKLAMDILPSETSSVSQEQLNSELLNAAGKGHAIPNCIIVWSLLKAGADVNAKDENGRTALYHAARMGNYETCALLIENGADVKTTDNSGSTALHIAAAGGYFIDICVMLMRNGADLNAKNKEDSTPLHCAASAASNGRDKVFYFFESAKKLNLIIGQEAFLGFIAPFRECLSL